MNSGTPRQFPPIDGTLPPDARRDRVRRAPRRFVLATIGLYAVLVISSRGRSRRTNRTPSVSELRMLGPAYLMRWVADYPRVGS